MMERVKGKGEQGWTLPTYKRGPVPVVLGQARQNPKGGVLLYFSGNHYSPWVGGQVADNKGMPKGVPLPKSKGLSKGQQGKQGGKQQQKKWGQQQDKLVQDRKK